MTDNAIGRLAVLLAVTFLALGKVAYGTWLIEVPSPVYVFFCFATVTAFFLPLFGRGIGRLGWKPLLILNGATALCFLFFFFALKLVEPAVAGALQFGTGPIIAVLIHMLATGVRPPASRVLACAGLLAGCIVLAISAVTGAGFASDVANGWIGLAAVLLSALGSVLITISSKQLSLMGWTAGAIIAHRCYLIVPLALLLSFESGMSEVAWSPQLVLTLMGVGLVATILPLILFQVGIERTTPHAVLVMMTFQPTITFLVEGFSSQYTWTALTLTGLAIINLSILADLWVNRRG